MSGDGGGSGKGDVKQTLDRGGVGNSESRSGSQRRYCQERGGSLRGGGGKQVQAVKGGRRGGSGGGENHVQGLNGGRRGGIESGREGLKGSPGIGVSEIKGGCHVSSAGGGRNGEGSVRVGYRGYGAGGADGKAAVG